MIVEIDRTDICNMLSGVEPSYEEMNRLERIGLGYYVGGFNDEWHWCLTQERRNNMKQEEKQLLLIDLCARSPYGVKVKNTHSDTVYDLKEYMYCLPTALATNFKPYLRPMSSMTEDEYKEFSKISGLYRKEEGNYFSNHLSELGNSIITERVMVRTIDWLNSHHIDYRGLIEKGLALEAPKDMYKTE